MMGVSPLATVPALAMTGTKLPALFSLAEELEALAAALSSCPSWQAPPPKRP